MREVATLSTIRFVDCEHILGIFIFWDIMKIKSLVGYKFNMLAVIKKSHVKNNRQFWICLCKCGKQVIIDSSRILSRKRNQKSCGCMQRINASLKNKTHGQSRTPEYFVYRSMLDRCYRKTTTGYHDYGGRGICVCKRWRKSFVNFIKDMGKRPSPKYSIERKNSNGDYKPSNCRWATRKEQNSNQRRNIRLTYNGETKILSDWARTIGINPKTLQVRIVSLHWPVERALTEPLRKSHNKVTYRGEAKTMADWARKFSLPANALYLRIFKSKWPLEKAFNTPLRSWSSEKPTK